MTTIPISNMLSHNIPMDIITTSIDAILQRASNNQNKAVDISAVEAFCALVSREKDGVLIGVKLIARRLHSRDEKEVLQTLYVLDTAMVKCGKPFQSEIGKFRFLNEIIKLVSPKYLGMYTPTSIKQRVLQLLYLWIVDYPNEAKIKEAYEMLKRQGLLRDLPLRISSDMVSLDRSEPSLCNDVANGTSTNGCSAPSPSLIIDDENSRNLEKLLRSKDPEDLRAANRLIKKIVKDEERRVEIKSRRISELESLGNNIKLLNEMLDTYRKGISSSDDFDLIKELYSTCSGLQGTLSQLTQEALPSDDIRDIFSVSEDLNHVLKKYEKQVNNKSNDFELLDLASNDVETLAATPQERLHDDYLSDDIFSTPNNETKNILKPVNCDILSNVKANREQDDSLLVNYITPQNENKSPISTNNAVLDDSQCSDELYRRKLTTTSDAITKTNADCGVKLSDIFVLWECIQESFAAPIVALEEPEGLTVTFHFSDYRPAPTVRVAVVTISSKKNKPLKNLLFRAIVSKECKIKLQAPSTTELPPFAGVTTARATQIILVSNPDNIIKSFNFIVSYNIDEETYTEMGNIDL